MNFKIVMAAVVAFSQAHSVFAAPVEFSGRATVIDGDTIDIQGQRIRLNGIDAPESSQTCQNAAGEPYRCGKDAAFALDEFLAKSRPTTCRSTSMDRYKRAVASCARADGADVQTWLVEQGHALDWPKYSHGRYADAEEQAKKTKLGIWAGTFDTPCVVRAEKAKRVPKC